MLPSSESFLVWYKGDEKYVRKTLCTVMTVNEMQFVFLPYNEGNNAVYLEVERRVSLLITKRCMCSVDLEKACSMV